MENLNEMANILRDLQTKIFSLIKIVREKNFRLSFLSDSEILKLIYFSYYPKVNKFFTNKEKKKIF